MGQTLSSLSVMKRHSTLHHSTLGNAEFYPFRTEMSFCRVKILVPSFPQPPFNI